MTTKTDSLRNTLQKLIPHSLDDVIRDHRDTCRLASASDEELAQLNTDIIDKDVRHTLTHWRIIMLHIVVNDVPFASPRLVGRVLETRESWITSHVVGLDADHGLVRTINSIYRIEGERAEESELDLIYICAALNYWGLGQYLGVPEFFF